MKNTQDLIRKFYDIITSQLDNKMSFELCLSMYEIHSIPYMEMAIDCAIVAIDEQLEDLRESKEVVDESSLHPHANGLITASFGICTSRKKELEELRSKWNLTTIQ